MLVRTETAFDECEHFLSEASAEGTPIESYLVQYLLACLCAEIQENLRRIAVDHFKRNGDVKLGQFAESVSNSHLIRGVKITNIAGFLGNFGSDVKEAFHSGLKDREITLYGNVVDARDKVAHGAGATITMKEFRDSLPIGLKVIEQFRLALDYEVDSGGSDDGRKGRIGPAWARQIGKWLKKS